MPTLPWKTNNAPPHQTQFREIITRTATARGLYAVRKRLRGGGDAALYRPGPVVSNVPSNITMTVIAALINAGPTASRRPVTPPGFNAILSGVADYIPRSLGRVARIRVYCEGTIRSIDRACTVYASSSARIKIAKMSKTEFDVSSHCCSCLFIY